MSTLKDYEQMANLIHQVNQKNYVIKYVRDYIMNHRKMTRAAYPHLEYSICIDTPELDNILDMLYEGLKPE